MGLSEDGKLTTGPGGGEVAVQRPLFQLTVLVDDVRDEVVVVIIVTSDKTGASGKRGVGRDVPLLISPLCNLDISITGVVE